MAKEIKIKRKQPVVEEYEYEFNNIKKEYQPQIPVGSVINGIEVIKPQTDYVEGPAKTEEEFQKEQRENAKELAENVLSKEEEEKVKEKLGDGGKVNELSKRMEATEGDYEPGCCVNKKVENERMPDELKIARYLAKQYRERVKKLFAEMTDEEVEGLLSDEKRKEIDSIIDEMVRPRYRKYDCVNKKYPFTTGVPREIIDALKEDGFAAPEDAIVETFKKLGYVSPKCRVIEEEDLKPEDKKPVAGWFNGICQEMMDLHERKNKDYGNAAHESYEEFGLISYVIRLNDKMKRLKSLTKPGIEQEVKSESIEDTLMDLAAYAIMAIESLRTS